MDLKKILKENGVAEDILDKVVDIIKQEIPKEFVSKVQYSKKTNMIDELHGKIADLEAKTGNDEYKQKYESLEKEVKTKEIKDIIRANLKDEKANEKAIKLLEKEFDIETIEVENGKIKDWDNLIKPVKENYEDFFAKEIIIGGGKAPTPIRNIERTFSKEDIEKMTTEEINENWDTISKTISKM